MTDAAAAIDIYRQATVLNREDPLLTGSLLEFPDYGQVVMTGDLHGHRRNFAKLQRFCDLEHAPVRHVVLHELIHEEPDRLTDPDLSHELLQEAAAWKCAFPDQVHFLQSNHELSQLSGHEISKGGRVVTRDFEQGLEYSFGAEGGQVLEPLLEFLATFPLAGRTPNRVFLAHSVPGPRTMAEFDAEDLRRPTTWDDLTTRSTVYALVWGRYQSKAGLSKLSDMLDVDLFVCGHQPQEEGFEVLHDRMIILASEHNHGMFLPFDLSREVTISGLTQLIRPFAAIE
ncbi:MAG: metallophosphoesterase [Planctomycetota bacterium]|jgi:hypothetical protein